MIIIRKLLKDNTEGRTKALIPLLGLDTLRYSTSEGEEN
jgi:hypothetical protein